MTSHQTRFTFANVTSVLALVVSLGFGTAYAAQLPKNSVGAKQIKTNAVKSGDVKNRTLQVSDLSSSTLADLRAPRAYGVVRANGTLVPFRSKGVTVARVPSTQGQYCLTPTPSSGIDPTRTTIVATADLDGSGLNHMVMVVGADEPGQHVLCPDGFYLYTRNDDGSGYTDANITVSFVIP